MGDNFHKIAKGLRLVPTPGVAGKLATLDDALNPSEDLILTSGNQLGTDVTGLTQLTSGNAAAAISGNVDITTGTGTGSGAILVHSADSALGNTGLINIKSGDATDFLSGGVDISTGNTTNAQSGSLNLSTGNATGFESGAINILTGTSDTEIGSISVATFAAGAGVIGGTIELSTGPVENTVSGFVDLFTGEASASGGESGSIDIFTGNTLDSDTGGIFLTTGNSTDGETGNISFRTGPSSTSSTGDIELATSDAGTNAGSISLSGGDGATGGSISLSSGSSGSVNISSVGTFSVHAVGGGSLLWTPSTTLRRGDANNVADENVEEQYWNTIPLTGSMTNATATLLTFDSTVFEGCIVDYKIKDDTSLAVRVGQLYIATNNSSVSITDSSTETATVGVTWSAVLSGDNVLVRYTTTANNKTMRADIKRLRI